MRRINNSLTSKVTKYLTVAFFVPYLSLVIATKAVAQVESQPVWAVLEFVNNKGTGPATLGKMAADAVRNELAKTGKYEILSEEQVTRTQDALNLQPPVTQTTSLVRLGTELRANSVVTGEVVNQRIVKVGNGKKAEVILKVRVLDVVSGLLVNGAALAASSTIRSNDSDDESVLADALAEGAMVAVTDIGRHTLPQATVLNTQEGKIALINRGTRSGFDVGQELIISRGRTQVATGKVTETDQDSSYIQVTHFILGIQPGDKVRAIFKVPDIKDKFNSNGSVQVIKPKKTSNSGLFTIAAVLGLIFVAVSGGRGSSQDLVGDFIAEATNETGTGPAVYLSWRPDLFTKGNSNRVQWQIWRNDWVGTPVLVTSGGQTHIVDDTTARTFTYGDIPLAGGTECTYEEMPDADAEAVTGVVSGVPYQYQVSLIYKILGMDLPISDPPEGYCFFSSVKTSAKGSATPFGAIELTSPTNGAEMTGPITFTFSAMRNAAYTMTCEYIIQISTSPLFNTNVQTLDTFTRTEANPTTLTSGPYDLTGIYPTYSELYWRVGVRNIADVPGPKKDAGTKLRYVFFGYNRLVRSN